uniref:Uncharacterized protein n=1 Tax=Timema bartmani TaxID=61472 RepID=A0A7R9ETY3_9NEOP|nr:unnamed protein product [Timema bartmani]
MVIPSLREAQAKLNTRLEEAFRENEKLRTQLQMMKLEREKFHILLTSKDNELEKFKLEVKGIQELVADQLTNMKNFVNHEKARDHLDNIIRVVSSHTQSLGFDTELESMVSDVSHEPSGGGEGRGGPHCSSPTSSMSSSLGIYPSWQVISRISSATNQEIDTKSTSDIVLLGCNSRSLDRSKDFTSDVNFDEAHLLESSTPPAFASLQIYTILENNCENTPSRASFKLEEVTPAKLVDITQTNKSSDVAKVKSSDKVKPNLSPGKEDNSETVRLHKWFEEIKSLKWWNKDVELPDPPRPFDDVTEPDVNSQISEMSGDRFTLNSDLLEEERNQFRWMMWSVEAWIEADEDDPGILTEEEIVASVTEEAKSSEDKEEEVRNTTQPTIKRKCTRICVKDEWKTTHSTPDQDLNLDLSIGSIVYCESSALDHAATKSKAGLYKFNYW